MNERSTDSKIKKIIRGFEEKIFCCFKSNVIVRLKRRRMLFYEIWVFVFMFRVCISHAGVWGLAGWRELRRLWLKKIASCFFVFFDWKEFHFFDWKELHFLNWKALRRFLTKEFRRFFFYWKDFFDRKELHPFFPFLYFAKGGKLFVYSTSHFSISKTKLELVINE